MYQNIFLCMLLDRGDLCRCGIWCHTRKYVWNTKCTLSSNPDIDTSQGKKYKSSVEQVKK